MKTTTNKIPAHIDYKTHSTFTFTSRGNEYSVYYSGNGSITISQSKSFKVWRGPGKTFFTFDAMFENYKSAEIRFHLTIIQDQILKTI